MSFHPEVLAPAQQRVLRSLAPLMARRGFYLAGGTAVAAHLGHRHSVDLDWFTSERLDDPMRLAQEIRTDGVPLITTTVQPGTLHGTVSGVRVSALEYQYPLLSPCLTWSEFRCPVASLDDLACMKLSAVAQRGAKKDFVDIYALGQQFSPLPDLLRHYQRKYSIDDITHVIYALVYFDDADVVGSRLANREADSAPLGQRTGAVG